jgi:hypothetical protein
MRVKTLLAASISLELMGNKFGARDAALSAPHIRTAKRSSFLPP